MSNIQLLYDKFAITKLNANTRDFAGMYISDQIITAKTHIQCINEYRRHHTLSPQNQVKVLHFLQQDNELTCFIDFLVLPPFQRADLELVIRALLIQVPKITNIYAYTYPDAISKIDLKGEDDNNGTSMPKLRC